MKTIHFDTYQDIRHVVPVGCGGTGSQWARSLARTLYDMRRRGLQTPVLTFVDPDRVEAKNVGRQMYTEADVGHFKAELLARRFNYALGLEITWHNEPFDPHIHIERHATLICGAVDNHAARRAIAEADTLWIDAGNHHASGQVIVGNTGDAEQVMRAFERLDDVDRPTIHTLPNAGLVFPSLLEPEPEPEASPDLSCAELVEAGAQHLLINDLIATIAAQYAYKLLHRQRLASFVTFVDGEALSMRSAPITRDGVLACVTQGQPDG
jgi:PRTRC genetic system ThiF family protein